jgi:predicted MFS family arabinose efflux permease
MKMTANPLPSRRRFIWSIVTAQVLVQIGAFSLPALLPSYIAQWHLSKTEAGWLVGIFFAAYVITVPVLVALTDRVPTRNVYVVGAGMTALAHLGFAFIADSFWWGMLLRAMAGIGWAGAYMPGLKAITDTLEGNAQSRAVSAHAAGVGIAGAVSYAVAGLIASLFGPPAAFLFGGICATTAIVIAMFVMPNKPAAHAKHADPRALLDFRPVFRNRPAMAWIAGYTFHSWEMAGLRAWGVTFLTLTAAHAGTPRWLPTPTVLFTIAGMVGIAVSIAGNEMSQRIGRIRIVTLAMTTSAALALCTGWTVGMSEAWAAILVVAWLASIFLDSAALTAGTVQAADPALRGATMGLHSMCGYAGGFIGPLGVGLALDLAGSNLRLGWGLGFSQLAIISLIGLAFARVGSRTAASWREK